MAPLILTWYSERSHRRFILILRSASPYRPYHSPAPSHSSRLLLLPFLTVARPFPPKARSAVPPLPPSRRARIALPQPRALSTVQQRARLPFLAARPALPQSAPSLTLLLLPSLICASPTTSPLPPPIFSPHLLRLAAPCGAPCPSHNPPLHPPPPLLSPISSLSTISPLLHLFPLFICCSCCFLLLMATSLALPSLPLLVLQLAPDGSAVNFPSWLNCLERTLSSTLVSGFNLWFVTQQSGSGAIPTSPSAPTSSSSDPYADGLRAAIAETERLVATAQATATAAPDNAAARDLARILAESLESTRKRLTEHLAAPSPRSASTPLLLALPLRPFPLLHLTLTFSLTGMFN
ncbi:unnamed protein product [Closterium sp. Naga37s-1]|nr:unnamed protein product [Closterium sp. Naga37s-1]